MKRILLMLCLMFIMLFGALATSAFAVNYTPVGNLDVVSNNRVAGWAWDRNAGYWQIWIHIYVRRPNMSVRRVVGVTTPVYRRDVNSHLGRAYGFWGGGYHGFDTKIKLYPGERITAHAINAPAGYNPALGTKIVPPNRVPRGNVDILQPRRIAGWAKDDDCPSKRLPIHVYIKGSPYIRDNQLIANSYRSDVGSYAFDRGVGITQVAGNNVSVYAIGVNSNCQYDGRNKRIGYINGFPGKANSIITRKKNGGYLFMEGNSFSTDTLKQLRVKSTGYFSITGFNDWRLEWPTSYGPTIWGKRTFPDANSRQEICMFRKSYANYWDMAKILYAYRGYLWNPVSMYRSHVDHCADAVSSALDFKVKSQHTYWNGNFSYTKNTEVACKASEDCWFKTNGVTY